LPNWGTVLLSDTVGFIRDLPHSLVASFKSTLEETRQADLLLHVADASNPDVFGQISAVYKVLSELGIKEKNTLLVLNKIDAIRSPAVLNRVLDRYPNAIPVSAKGCKGFEMLTDAVGEALGREFLDLEIEVDPGDGRLLAYLAAKGEILSQRFEETVVHIRAKLPAGAMGPIHRSAVSFRPTGAATEAGSSATTSTDTPATDPIVATDVA
ncbi:MAG: GTPase HflX, partial [Planctomycetota bacterium]